MKFFSLVGLFIPLCLQLSAQVKPVAEWYFWPDYTLPGNAKNYPGPKLDNPASYFQKLEYKNTPLLFFSEEPTERLINFLAKEKIPQEDFTIELWLLVHVNQPVGALITLKDRSLQTEPDWLLGYYGDELVYSLKTVKHPYGEIINKKVDDYWSGNFLHIVAVYEAGKMKLYYNGNLLDEITVGARAKPAGETAVNNQIELAAYLKNEPYMDLGNLVKSLRIYDQAISKEEITSNFTHYKKMVERGILYPDLFHFATGPYLNYATKSSINLLWEADRETTATIEYGTSLPLKNKLEVNSERLIKEDNAEPDNFIGEAALTGLASGTKYFYQITLKDKAGNEIQSGVLTFKTAVEDDEAFAFAVIGDTEARPHINDRVAKLIWGERPDFCLNLGDLTDGGIKRQKFQWNYEYFSGMTQLHSRIPVFPVAGNGESDLYWYNRYHALPEPEGYYKFTYGNADFFMLDSNQEEEFAPGKKQYVWLEEQLKSSQANWKFVCHHHAPYSADEDDYGDSWKEQTDMGDLEVRKIVPLYEKYGVDMVFFGHLHTYQRTLPIASNQVNEENGVIYVQAGGGGGNLEDFAPARAWFSAKTYRGHHYFTINIFNNSLSFKMYDTEGRLKDFLELKK
ncbi:metallophosphoesterase [Chondrinema litorale]|uniref:metallophosphoesterase n=1 Tax=Chondrinema litorale TaxID=2994555 RepID=UPI0025433AB5|nr:metallophosphoesterase [Chondrinema litorale]UZR93557.1 metallophosphoesterase [Chondrinema litorale]